MNRSEYEADIIATFARLGSQPAIADADRDSDRKLFQAVQDAAMCLEATVRAYNAMVSSNPAIDWGRIKDALTDEIPTEADFEERLNEVRRWG